MTISETPPMTNDERRDRISPLDFVHHLAAVEAARLASDRGRQYLLDVGAAFRDFLALAHFFGWEDTQAVGISQHPRAASRRFGVFAKYETLEEIPGDRNWDFITAWGLIEHLPDLTSFMTAILAHLRHGGVFLCSTPDADQAALYPRPEEWLGFHVSLEQLRYFGSASLHKLLSRFFPHVVVWTTQTRGFYHQLFAMGFTEIPPAPILEHVHNFATAGSPGHKRSSSSMAWVTPTALMRLHPSPECRVKLRRNYRDLRAELEHVEGPNGMVLRTLLEAAVGDLVTARREMGEFIKHARRTSIPAAVVESLVTDAQENSRAQRVARILKRTAARGRNCSRIIRTSIRLATAHCRSPLARLHLRKILSLHRPVKGVIVYPPFVEYFSLRQRPHQLGSALAEQGYLVFFCTSNPRRDRVDGFRKLRENFYVCSVPLEVFRGIDDPIVYVSRPAGWRRKIKEITGKETGRIFYDWIDDLGVFGREEDQMDEHAELLSSAEVVAASASVLFAEARKVRPDVLLLPNAVRVEDFQHIATHPGLPPAVLQDAVNQGRPIIGYYGSVSSWFDFELLERVLEMNLEKTFIIIGRVWGLGETGQAAWRRLNQATNLLCVGEVDYTELGGYLRWCDVAIIPFVLNEITHATSPVKLFEYMAAGKPIVTTGMLECKKYESVLWGNTPGEFSRRLTDALSLRGNHEYLGILRREALRNTWADRASQLDRALAKIGEADRVPGREQVDDDHTRNGPKESNDNS